MSTYDDLVIINQVMPEYDERSAHEIEVRATADETFGALQNVDLGDDPVVRTLFRLRGLSPRGATLDRFRDAGFTDLSGSSGTELALGIIGRFWTPTGGLRDVAPEDFRSFDEPGYAKAVWSFVVVPEGRSCRIETETRVSCTDDRARRRFRAYWLVVGPFSGSIRRRMLQLVRTRAEAAAGR